MERQGHIDLLKRLLHYVETRTTSLADAPWCNDVSVYTDPSISLASSSSCSAGIRC
jgi:hypothetical protein